ncbi:high-potential iron-sulfur protein [Endothiovibrio diazotrophicus]
MNQKNVSRRAVLKGLAAIPVVATLSYSATASAEALNPDDALAKAMEFTLKSEKADQDCANCALYQGGANPTGPCPIFGGKDVPAVGWCKSWVKKS